MPYAEAVRDLNELASKSHLISQLAMITVYLLDDPNYTRQDAARDLVGIINELDSLSSWISLDDETMQDEVAAAEEQRGNGKDHSTLLAGSE